MCRWLAYAGDPIFLEDVLVKPVHSLLRQSRFAEENIVVGNPVIPDGPFPSNDDGFGMGWYGERPFPGVYRDLRPAWNDYNYLSLAGQVKSGLFMAHMRAAYQGLVQRTNCHPFRYQNWLFQHNGEINDFLRIKRDIALAIAPDLFPLIQGTTDTEYFFYLLLSFGLTEHPKTAVEKGIQFVENLRAQHHISAPFTLTACLSDGQQLYAIRYASHGHQKSLYINNEQLLLADADAGIKLPSNALVVVSEPLSKNRAAWDAIADNSFLTVTQAGGVKVERLYGVSL